MKLRAFQANFVNLLQINESNKLNQQRKMHLKHAHVGFRWNEVAATNLPFRSTSPQQLYSKHIVNNETVKRLI